MQRKKNKNKIPKYYTSVIHDHGEVFETSPGLAKLIYHQCQHYFNHILKIKPGMTVIDAGANIGLFTMELMKRTNNMAKIYCFEPIPFTCSLLRFNMEKYPQNIRPFVFNCGLSDKNTHVEFTHSNNLSAMASYRHEDLTELNVEFIMNSIYDPSCNYYYEDALIHPKYFPKSWVKFMCKRAEEDIKKSQYKTTCELRKLSDVIFSRNIEKIDLLKIDVEGAEWDLLCGINKEDLNKISQIVIELHDVDDRLNKVKGMLASYKFSDIHVTQEDELKKTNIYTLFAVKN